MRIKASKKIVVVFMFVLVSVFNNIANANAQYSDSVKMTNLTKHTIQLNALEFMGHIYSAVYLYQFSPKNQLMLGLAYQNQRNNYFGTTHAPSLIVGYRRYFWKGLNAEYALWPAYNHLWEKNERKYYNSFEVWGEFRTGYDLDFKIGKSKLFVLPQLILGKGVIDGNKPQSFKDYYKNKEHVFYAFNIALGIKL